MTMATRRMSGPRSRVLRTLHEGPVEDETGRAVHRLLQKARLDSHEALAQLLPRLEREGLVERHVRGRRTYRLALTEEGRRQAALPVSIVPALSVEALRRRGPAVATLPSGPASTWRLDDDPAPAGGARTGEARVPERGSPLGAPTLQNTPAPQAGWPLSAPAPHPAPSSPPAPSVPPAPSAPTAPSPSVLAARRVTGPSRPLDGPGGTVSPLRPGSLQASPPPVAPEADEVDYEALAGALLKNLVRATATGAAPEGAARPVVEDESRLAGLTEAIATLGARASALEARVRILEHDNRWLATRLERTQQALRNVAGSRQVHYDEGDPTLGGPRSPFAGD